MEQAKTFACNTVDRVAISPQNTVSAMMYVPTHPVDRPSPARGSGRPDTRPPRLSLLISDALTNGHPRHRYRIGIDAKYIFTPLVKLPTFLTDYIYWLTTAALPLPASLQAKRDAQF